MACSCDQSRTFPKFARCACGHKISVHTLDAKKRRKACSHMDEKGQCECKQPH